MVGMWSGMILGQQKQTPSPKRFEWKQIDTAEKCVGRLARRAHVFFGGSQDTVKLVSDRFGTERRRKRYLLKCDLNRK